MIDNLYWAHPFNTRNLHEEWKKKFSKVGINLIDPFVDLGLDERQLERHTKHEALEPTIMVQRDLDAIRKADGLIAYINGSVSYGTIMEMVYAQDKYRLPVYAIITNGYHEHQWLVYHTTRIFTSLNQALEYFGKGNHGKN